MPPSAGQRSWSAKGGTLADVTAGDFLERSTPSGRPRAPRDYSAVSWRLLRRPVPSARGAALAQLPTIGQRSPAELIDRYQLTCRPVRDLLVDYLQERQPVLDHRSLDAWPSSSAGTSGLTSSTTTPASAA
jgi:hypothetical protein